MCCQHLLCFTPYHFSDKGLLCLLYTLVHCIYFNLSKCCRAFHQIEKKNHPSPTNSDLANSDRKLVNCVTNSVCFLRPPLVVKKKKYLFLKEMNQLDFSWLENVNNNHD